MRAARPSVSISSLSCRAQALKWSVAIGALVCASPAFAQSASPGSVVTLDTLVVESGQGDGLEAARERAFVAPGGASFLTTSQLPIAGNLTLGRALSEAPGVIVQEFFGSNDQPRLQIRGSGLQQNPVERGVLMLRDGLPLNRADGSYTIGLANPGLSSGIEIYRGQTANRLGATVNGGVINFISPTGATQPGFRGQISGGSFGSLNGTGQFGWRGENWDALLQADGSRRDGFRVYNKSHRAGVAGNIGVKLSEHVKTRIFFGYTDLGFDVAGPVTRAQLRADSRQVHGGPRVVGGVAIEPGPNVLRDRPRRETRQAYVGARTSAEYGPHILDLTLGYSYTDDMFRFPIPSGVRETRGHDFTAVGRYAFKPDVSAELPLFEATAQYTIGSARRDNYQNASGRTGALFGTSDLDASTLSIYAGANLPVWRTVTLSPAISYAHATRDNTERYTAATRPTIAYAPAMPTMLLPNGAVPTQSTTYSRSYQGWSPSLSMSWRPVPDQIVYASLSRSFEPPTHDDLLATINGTPNSSPGRPNPAAPFAAAAVFAIPALKAQTATTVELGWRGRWSGLSWDALVYYSRLRNELLSLRDVTGASLGAVNAGRTRHLGAELGMGAQLGAGWSGRIAYTFQDFRFVDDPLRGNNRIAGAPRHLLNATLQYQATAAWLVQGGMRWSMEKTPVDNMNTLFADPYALFDLRSEYAINDRVTLFGEVTNLFDKKYASSTLVVDMARPDQAGFQPGTGRGFYAGMKARF